MSLIDPDYDAVLETLVERSYEDLQKSLSLYTKAIKVKRERDAKAEQDRRAAWLKDHPLNINEADQQLEPVYYHGEHGEESTEMYAPTMRDLIMVIGRVPGPADKWTVRWLGRDQHDEHPSANWFLVFIESKFGTRQHRFYMSHCPVDIPCPMYRAWVEHLKETDPASHQYVTEAMTACGMYFTQQNIEFSPLLQRAAQQRLYRQVANVEFIPSPMDVHRTHRSYPETTVDGFK